MTHNENGPVVPRRDTTLFVDENQRVLPEWIDYNGHMSVVHYPRVFERAFNPIYDELALGKAMVAETGISIFTAEQHITFKRELLLDDPLRITTQLIGLNGKKSHWLQTIYHAEQHYISSTCEHLLLFVDMKARHVTEAPPEALRKLECVLRDRNMPVPDGVGRRIGMDVPSS